MNWTFEIAKLLFDSLEIEKPEKRYDLKRRRRKKSIESAHCKK